MTASVRQADLYSCSFVLFMLELEAIINYLGVGQPWTPYITFIPGAHPLHSHFISVLLNLLMSADISGRYPNIKNILKHDKNHDKSNCSAPWSCTVTAGKAGLRDRAEEQLFKKTPPVFLDKHCLISRHCWFYLLPNYFHLSGHGSAAPAASCLNGKGGAPHTHTVQLIGQKT